MLGSHIQRQIQGIQPLGRRWRSGPIPPLPSPHRPPCRWQGGEAPLRKQVAVRGAPAGEGEREGTGLLPGATSCLATGFFSGKLRAQFGKGLTALVLPRPFCSYILCGSPLAWACKRSPCALNWSLVSHFWAFAQAIPPAEMPFLQLGKSQPSKPRGNIAPCPDPSSGCPQG